MDSYFYETRIFGFLDAAIQLVVGIFFIVFRHKVVSTIFSFGSNVTWDSLSSQFSWKFRKWHRFEIEAENEVHVLDDPLEKVNFLLWRRSLLTPMVC